MSSMYGILIAPRRGEGRLCWLCGRSGGENDGLMDELTEGVCGGVAELVRIGC